MGLVRCPESGDSDRGLSGAEPGLHELVISVPFVLFGLFRYWFVVEALDGGESPTDALLADWQLLLTVVLWVAACGWALWPLQG